MNGLGIAVLIFVIGQLLFDIVVVAAVRTIRQNMEYRREVDGILREMCNDNHKLVEALGTALVALTQEVAPHMLGKAKR